MTEFEKLVNATFGDWMAGGFRQGTAAVQCSRNARLAVRVYVKLQNSRGLKPGQTRKDFVHRLDLVAASRAAA